MYFVPSMHDLPITDGRHPPDVVGPWARQARNINSAHHTTPGGYFVPKVGRDHVGADIDAYARDVSQLHGDVQRAQTVNLSLGRVSGAMSRVTSITGPHNSGVLPNIDPRAYGSTNGLGHLTVEDPSPLNISRYLRGVDGGAWYENTWLQVGAAVAVGLGAGYLLFHKKR